MKKYKLIKEYPGSPKLGTIISQLGTSQFYEDKSNSAIMKQCFDYKVFSKHPEFWEEIVEKDYEILSVINPLLNNCLISENLENGYSFEYKLNKFPHLKIKSIKRLSDGEVFTVGNYILYTYINSEDEYVTIRRIIEKIYFIENNRISLYVGEGLNLSLKNVENIKKPLFTTEDGVDIFNMQQVWYIPQDWKDRSAPFIYKVSATKGSANTNHLYFSTKEAAKNYITNNKKSLSLKEVHKILKKELYDKLGFKYGIHTKVYKELKKIAEK